MICCRLKLEAAISSEKTSISLEALPKPDPASALASGWRHGIKATV